MENGYPGRDRREFLRYTYEKPVHYSIVTNAKDKEPLSSSLMNAVSKNLSISGILFSTKNVNVPDISSIVILDLDYRTSLICQEIEEKAVIVNNKLLGKVVRIEEEEDGMCDVGVAFITKSDDLSKDIKTLVG